MKKNLLVWGLAMSLSAGMAFTSCSDSDDEPNQGLSQATVKSALMDRKGRLWIGTQNGLNYYSQQTLKTFIHQSEEPYSLPDNYINHIAEDSLENIWIATSKGMVIFNNDSVNFHPTGCHNIYSSLCTEGGILFGSDNIIYRYNYKNRQMDSIRICHKAGIDSTEYRIQKMLLMGKDKILIGTKEKGIFLYDSHTQRLSPFTKDIHHLLISLYVASNNQVYASFYGDGIYCYDLNGERIKYYTSDTSELNNNYVLDIIEHKGKLWIATDGGGINILDLASDEIEIICHVAGDSFSLPVNSITLLYKDRDGNLWAGSVRGGIFNIKETYIQTYKDVALNNTNGTSDKSIISLYEEKDGKLWIGTDGGGINLYDPHTDLFTHFPSTYGDKVASIARMSDTELLVSLYTKGFWIFNKNTGKYRPFTVVDEGTNYKECFYGYLPLAHQVADDKIYIISYRPWVYHPRAGTFSLMPAKGLANTDALRLAYSNERFSLLKRNNQIFYVSQETDSINLLCELDKNETITSLACEGNIIYIGTDRGLGYYDMDRNEIQHIPTKCFESVSFLLSDQKGRLWISAHNKLFSYQIKEQKFTIWNSSDGFLPNEILFAYYKLSNPDFIYLCGAEGLVKIHTDIPLTETQMPKISLSDVQYNGISYLKNVKDHTITIPWNYNSLAIHTRIHNEDIFQKNLLRYTISGVGKQTFETFESELSLSSLSPGIYKIWVSCSAKDGSYTSPVLLINILITPPWYKSNWFIFLTIVLLVTLVTKVAQWHLRKQKQEMRDEVGDFVQTVLYNVLDNKEDVQASPDATTVPAEVTPQPSKADEEFIEKLNRAINENLSSDKLSIKFLTETLAMSRASLYNKVKQLTGMGVNEYINRLRIERSVYLLTHTNLSINEISYETGFTYPRYFSTSFKQIKGVTPSQFKEENKKKNAE
ncbi:MAG: two-component regulator propeller domain-containing protein [Bacteroidales bacterium]|nr:two-component regulator propeller domain-containing protein [Bacteroidales bacterium]